MNKESTIKKLIYQVSFEHTEQLSEMLAPLEKSLEGLAYIDVEVNSLEDAYVKIADGDKKQVDKQAELAAQLEFEENVKTFMSTKPHSSFCQQFTATVARKMRDWKNDKKVMIMSFNPFLMPLIYIIMILVVLNEINMPEVRTAVFQVAFPLLIIFGIVTSCGIFAVTPTKDRVDKMRHLLSFAGMRSSAYYLGILTGDFIIFMIPQYMVLLLIIALQLDEFYKHLGLYILTIHAFAPPCISLVYNMAYMYNDPR